MNRYKVIYDLTVGGFTTYGEEKVFQTREEALKWIQEGKADDHTNNMQLIEEEETEMKLYSKDKDFYNLIEEARKQEKISDNYLTSGQYVTSIYESKEHRYKLVMDIDNGVYHSIEKEDKQVIEEGEIEMERKLIKEELEELYKELNELKEELQDYYSENSGFSNGADFSLGFASRSKNIMARINELEEELEDL